MSAREMLGERSVGTQSVEKVLVRSGRSPAHPNVIQKRVRACALFIGLSTGIHGVGCASEDQDPELGEAADALVTSEDGADDMPTHATARNSTVAAQVSRAGGRLVQTGVTGTLGVGTTVVAFTRDPDGAWHCTGDADCNKMFASGVCQGGILDSSCDTTKGVECWCY